MKSGLEILQDESAHYKLEMLDYTNYRNAWRYNAAPHEEQKLEEKEWKKLLKQGGLFVRNTYNFDQKQESNFWYVIKDSFGGMEDQSQNERKKLRHAFRNFDFRLINYDLLAEKGFPIVNATFKDYRVTDRPMNEKVFNDYLNHCKRNNYDYWGMFEKTEDKFVGFCAVHAWKDSCEYGVIGVLPEYKHNATYPYYGFFYKMNEYYLGKKGFKYVSDGSRSITEHSEIQDFLIHNFKFRKAYCQLEIHYRWWVKIVVNILYPFRKIIFLPRIKAVLNMESMRRGEK